MCFNKGGRDLKHTLNLKDVELVKAKTYSYLCLQLSSFRSHVQSRPTLRILRDMRCAHASASAPFTMSSRGNKKPRVLDKQLLSPHVVLCKTRSSLLVYNILINCKKPCPKLKFFPTYMHELPFQLVTCLLKSKKIIALLVLFHSALSIPS